MNQETLLPQIDQDAEQGFEPHLLQMVELERIARAIDVEDAILEQMRHAELELTIHLPASRSDGVAANISALQCLYSHSSGCITELAIGPDDISQPGSRFGLRQRLELCPAGTGATRRRGRNHLRSFAIFRTRDAPIVSLLLPAAASDAAESLRFFAGVRRQPGDSWLARP